MYAVMFYAPWCRYSRQLRPVWAELAEAYSSSRSVVVAEVDCVADQDACYKVTQDIFYIAADAVDGS